ncbi:MAG: hypothetical protein DCC55_21425 [Chloroflexi bacterium]|nr:MAG: hypothetical protein DCC55_21425 [Chloroflexota bacterium]
MAQAYFLDSSALVKRYLRAQGSTYVSTLGADTENLLYIAQIAGVEVVSAIARHALAKSISRRKAQTAITRFRADYAARFIVLLVNLQLIESAMQLAETHALRAYDAVQLATVLRIARNAPQLTLTFVCADEALNKVAQTLGLAIENPNQHD